MSYEIIEKLKQAIGQYEDTEKLEEIGRVIESGDGIVKIYGLKNVKSQEVLSIETAENKIDALALNLEEDSVGALVLGDHITVRSGDIVRRTNRLLSIDVGKSLLGRVVSPFGRPLDGKGPVFAEGKSTQYFLENDAPSVLDREPVNTPLHTGIKTIDSMIPIGRGQRELIIGDRQTGKTAIAIDTIINQHLDAYRKMPICIYVAIGQKESKIAKTIETLKNFGALEYTIIVSAPASSSAALWYLAPYAGCAIGEYFRDRGEDAVVIYDDLSKHAWAYRQISLLLRRPPGREAYPGDIFYLHSRLLERAAKLSKEKGGGSLTALPIVETQLGDVTAYIPTNIISITDGQIYLESDLFYQGIRPAVNVGLSVSRVGSKAQTSAMKRIAGKLRLELAQFRELQAFIQFASDVDDATKKKIKRGQVITEALKQPDLSPMPFEKQLIILYAMLNNYFDDIDTPELPAIQAKLIENVEKLHNMEIMEPLRKTGILTKEIEEKLKIAITKVVAK
ncbi:MAG: ATP synthase subunit alpha [Parcubacteria group bacterium GW2011_GWC2_39_11]|nr:MAG: ATP synthase subunit alpha [Parcubacteria group bacterium GW2011_GWC2_39_11]